MIIGFTGPARSGKDTAAMCVMTHDPRFTRMSFANPMKDMLEIGFDLNDKQLHGEEKETIDLRYGCTPRQMMQTLGTEWGRDCLGRDIWVKAMAARYVAGSHVVIPDVRFENEAQFVREHGVLVHIAGRGLNLGHVSEAGVVFREGDIGLPNVGTLEDLRLAMGSRGLIPRVVEVEGPFYSCRAVQHSDHAWDVNDTEPPRCS